MPGDQDLLLNERYTLTKKLSGFVPAESWLATDREGGRVLVKLWPYEGERPNEVIRALWDRELRNLFRLSSSPDADSKLVVLHDAGVDKSSRRFVMVLSAPGFEPLSAILESRNRYDWLRDMRQAEVRVALWRALRELAQGLGQLHQQQMLHRSLTSDSVLLDSAAGPESMRLGGFEWTVRVGQTSTDAHQTTLGTISDASSDIKHTHTFESDWYRFGRVAAHLLAGIDSRDQGPSIDHSAVLSNVREATKLSELEREFMAALLEPKRKLRLSRGYEIVRAIDEIIVRLDQPARFLENSYLAMAALLGPKWKLTETICDIDESISAINTEAQRMFIQADLETPRLIARAGSQGATYLLQGKRLVYFLKEYAELGSQPSGHWDLAFCDSPGEVRYSPGGDSQVEIRGIPVRVFRMSDIRTDPSIVSKAAVSWRPFLPKDSRSKRAKEKQERFHDFFRITNQVELLFRDAEIFPYRTVEYSYKEGRQELTIAEGTRSRSLPPFAEVSGGMISFLTLQRAEKRDGDKVYIGPEESVYLDRRVDLPEFWTIVHIDEERATVRLQRTGAKLSVPEKEGFLRSFDMFGQISLIRRRRRAIDRLKNHNYLLQAMRSPDQVFIDTGESDLPIAVDNTKVDTAKYHALQNIWRTRPIFALQGPPGTGKTTLVANLLGQIFADDSVAQVLVTAQAHSAVDVLRDKVSNDIFSGTSEHQRPLSIRLSKAGDQSQSDPDSVANTTLRILQRAEESVSADSEIGAEWLTEAKAARQALQRVGGEAGAQDLCELVKRSASIVYSTTTAGDLEELADLTQSFDWSLIEEAGKAHGFDLVLPLQTGHRWVLIGDQNQLPPYRFTDFRKGLLALNETVSSLLKLPERAGGLIDLDLLQSLRDMDQVELAERRDLWLSWLPVFGQLHRTCTEAIPVPKNGTASSHGLLASMLYQQHRMHPTIAGLISEAYYDRPIESLTVDASGNPLERVVHPFTAPSTIRNSQIVWLDVGWPATSGGVRERTRDGMETSQIEVDAIKQFMLSLHARADFSGKLRVAVLSPYRRQVLKISGELRDFYGDSTLTWLAARRIGEFPASTVDSFQGNQADVVIVSLVRSNDAPAGEGLGFLREASRMNVLFSRAERLLVLVGNWEFFKFQVQHASRDKNQPLGHWRLAIEYIENCISAGSACLIPAVALKDRA
jgi:KaiC/GvpD/RAD55 family RecA-like ATPase